MNPVYLRDYTYTLPDDRIARYPPTNRTAARLLFSNRGTLAHHVFQDLPTLLPPQTLLVFNDTKVIPARLHFRKETGADIEIFLLTPTAPDGAMAEAMQVQHACTWRCTIGNLKRWTAGLTLIKEIGNTHLEAYLIDRDQGLVAFRWETDRTFAELITQSGETPLPPYLQRKAEPEDRERYQTVYSHYQGAVAAPTAGLHFTDELLDTLKAKDIATDFLTLHVSAGTFQPVKTEDATQHTMHNEQVIVARQTVQNLRDKYPNITAVGTTSMRTLESIYWYGVKLMKDPQADFEIRQFDPYEPREIIPTTTEALDAVAHYMDRYELETIQGNTSLFILPGYNFKLVNALVTNFHQPASTLVMLIAAFAGPHWKTMYEEALQKDYRFLSYGDSSLIIP